jgi:hypothetical protein
VFTRFRETLLQEGPAEAEIHYFSTGHFALEEDAPGSAEVIEGFFDRNR